MRFAGLLILAGSIAGCARHALPDMRPLTGVVRFQSRQAPIRFVYPANWHPVPDDTILTLLPDAESSIGLHTLAIDQPDLPPHIPGLIPLVFVVHGFVNDLKSRYKEVVVQSVVDRTADGANGSVVHATAQRPAGQVVVTAFLCVHGNSVYVVDAETDPQGVAQATAAFNTVVDSIQWTD
jgi:hypothetical protein